MWPKFYRDYKIDGTLMKYQVEPSHGIIGCEMHDLNGWGTTLPLPEDLVSLEERVKETKRDKKGQEET